MVNWDDVLTAVRMVSTGQSTKVEGKGYLVYSVGTIIRIDLKDMVEPRTGKGSLD